MRFASLLVVGAAIVACGGSTTGSTDGTNGVGSQTGAFQTYRDGCDTAACDAQPPPKHQCVGGYPVSVCTKARGACGWQVDCASEPPPGYDGNVGVSQCPAATCGPLPTYDDKDCVYGFVVGEPQCERYGAAPCAWTRRCRPQPCEQTNTCKVLDGSKLGAACGGTDSSCPAGSSCASISVNIGDYVPPTCIQGNPCDALTCATGRERYILDSHPGQVGCGLRR